MKPIVAIVGRPNVGKSTLFNRLAGAQLAIVHDEPGVTRDRHYADTHVHGRDLTLIDTGGFEPDGDDPMGEGIARHVHAAIDEADAILFLLDGRAQPTPTDVAAVQLLRESDKPVLFLANRVDNAAAELDMGDLYRLGIDELFPISALHGRGMSRVESKLVGSLPAPAGDAPALSGDDIPRIALIGRPNAGKSSLLNRLAQSERSLVDHRPGTTRDPIDASIEYGGKHYVVIDTAGIRRRTRVDAGVEAASVMRAIRSIARADVIVLMCDVTEPIAEQDTRLFGLSMERARGVIVGLNKMDLLSEREHKEAISKAKDAFHFANWISFIPLSTKTGHGIGKLMQQVTATYAEFHRRIPTASLNKFFQEVLERHPPPIQGGRAPRLYYITQAETAPPVFVAMTNYPETIRPSYKRFVTNQIRKAFGFENVPVLLKFRARRRRERG